MTIGVTIETPRRLLRAASVFGRFAPGLERGEMRQAVLQLAALQDPDRVSPAGGVYAFGV
jgi:hypothetical protein